MNTIGISAFFHDSACCVLRDGKLVGAAEEERFSRIKHDAGVPRAAFRFCLDQARLSIEDIDCVAYYEQPEQKLARQIWMGVPAAVQRGVDPSRLSSRYPESQIRDGLGYSGRIEFVGHHEAHAASSFYFSGFPDAALLTVDGVGEWATTTYGRGSGADIELFEEVQFPHSLGLLYSTITSYLGFKVNSDEYKVMGLAPYGKPQYVDQISQLIVPGEGGQYRLAMEYFDFVAGESMYSERLPELFGTAPRERESEIGTFHQDVARSLQVVLEETLVSKVAYLHDRVPSENLCMAGGVALNCVANSKVLSLGPFQNLFVQPAASDAGGALGAAAIAHCRLTGQRPAEEPMPSARLGTGYDSDTIHSMLSATPISFADHRRDEAEMLRRVAELIADGKVVGWFQGRMEFGPRALGGRSILADPRCPDMRDRINALVKKREAFRPFAPAVLADRAGQHFELDHESPFMLEVAQVTSRLDLPAITHVDGSARVQTVDATAMPRFAGLLQELDRLTGCPIVLNTSFNVRGEPIVCTPWDALRCFIRARIDVLVLQDLVIQREDIPASMVELLDFFAPVSRSRISHDVYSFF